MKIPFSYFLQLDSQPLHGYLTYYSSSEELLLNLLCLNILFYPSSAKCVGDLKMCRCLIHLKLFHLFSMISRIQGVTKVTEIVNGLF